MQRKLWLLFRVLFTISIFAFLLYKVDWQRVISILPQLNLSYVAVAVALQFSFLGCMTLRWGFLLRRFNISAYLSELYRFYLISYFYGTVLPGVLGSDAVRLALAMKRFPEKKGVLLTTILFERGCGLLAVLLTASCSAAFIPDSIPELQDFSRPIHGITLAAFGLFAVFFVVKSFSEQWSAVENDHGFKARVLRLVYQFKRLSVKVSSGVIAFSLAAQIIDVVGAWLLGLALGIDQPILFYFLVMPLVFIAITLPISINGLGVREGVLAFFLVAVGGNVSDAVLLGFLIYFTRLALGLAGGILSLIRFGENGKRQMLSPYSK